MAPRDIANVAVHVTGSRVYTGSRLQPAFAVSDSGIAIDTGDYTNEYDPNVDAGAGAGSMKLTGQRNYTGTKTAAFDIEKHPLDGAAITLEATSYMHTGGRVLADVPHFSVYGVASKAPVPVFTDITNHPAKSDMEFAAARGLLSGTGEGTFSPDAAMTRGINCSALTHP